MEFLAIIKRLFGLSTISSNTPVSTTAPSTPQAIRPAQPAQPERLLDLGWMSPESEERKRQLLSERLGHEVTWGEAASTYLFYYIGECDALTDEEIGFLASTYFLREARWGDIELHRSWHIPGKSMYIRLRGNLRLVPSIAFRGRYCPLYQYGHGGGFCEDPEKDMCNFLQAWNPASQPLAS